MPVSFVFPRFQFIRDAVAAWLVDGTWPHLPSGICSFKQRLLLATPLTHLCVDTDTQINQAGNVNTCCSTRANQKQAVIPDNEKRVLIDKTQVKLGNSFLCHCDANKEEAVNAFNEDPVERATEKKICNAFDVTFNKSEQKPAQQITDVSSCDGDVSARPEKTYYAVCLSALSRVESPLGTTNKIHEENALAAEPKSPPFIFESAVEAISFCKKYKSAFPRWKQTLSYAEAEAFSLGSGCPRRQSVDSGVAFHGDSKKPEKMSIQPAVDATQVSPLTCSSSTEVCALTSALVPAKSLPYDAATCQRAPLVAPTSQQLVKLRKSIALGSVASVRATIWANPRFLVAQGETPTVLHEGCRYNAFHEAARAGQAEVLVELLAALRSETFFRRLYPEDCKTKSCTGSSGDENDGGLLRRRATRLIDLYLNTPDKTRRRETPLHFACRFGHTACVRLLLAQPECHATARNGDNQLAEDVICDRWQPPTSVLAVAGADSAGSHMAFSSDKFSKARCVAEIQALFANRFVLAIVRQDNGNGAARLEGPMTVVTFQKFRRRLSARRPVKPSPWEPELNVLSGNSDSAIILNDASVETRQQLTHSPTRTSECEIDSDVLDSRLGCGRQFFSPPSKSPSEVWRDGLRDLVVKGLPTISAIVGPMSPETATAVMAELSLQRARPGGLQLRRGDAHKGLETVVRQTAYRCRASWAESWPFLGSHNAAGSGGLHDDIYSGDNSLNGEATRLIDIASSAGLDAFESYLRACYEDCSEVRFILSKQATPTRTDYHVWSALRDGLASLTGGLSLIGESSDDDEDAAGAADWRGAKTSTGSSIPLPIDGVEPERRPYVAQWVDNMNDFTAAEMKQWRTPVRSYRGVSDALRRNPVPCVAEGFNGETQYLLKDEAAGGDNDKSNKRSLVEDSGDVTCLIDLFDNFAVENSQSDSN